jgi:hypothetical protein
MKSKFPACRLMFLVALGAVSLSAHAQQLVAEFSGHNNTTTRVFEVQAPWILNWRVTGNYTGSVGFELMLLDGKSRMHKGVILRLRRTGNGVKLFNESGSFRFRISAGLANWHLKVEEISEEEAKLYTPRKGS